MQPRSGDACAARTQRTGRRHKVNSARMEGVAAGQTAQGQPRAEKRTVHPDRIRSVVGTGRVKTAAALRTADEVQRRGDHAPVDPDRTQQKQAEGAEQNAAEKPAVLVKLLSRRTRLRTIIDAHAGKAFLQASMNFRWISANSSRFSEWRATRRMSASAGTSV